MSSLLWETPGTPYQVFCKYSRRVGNELRGLEGSVKWSVFYKPATTINLGVKEVSDVIVIPYHIYQYSDQMKAIG